MHILIGKHQRNCCTYIRSYAQEFRRLSSGHAADNNMRYRQVLALDLEAAVHLKEWHTIHDLVTEAQSMANDDLYALFADITLTADEIPADKVLETMEVRLKMPVQETALKQQICR